MKILSCKSFLSFCSQDIRFLKITVHAYIYVVFVSHVQGAFIARLTSLQSLLLWTGSLTIWFSTYLRKHFDSNGHIIHFQCKDNTLSCLTKCSHNMYIHTTKSKLLLIQLTQHIQHYRAGNAIITRITSVQSVIIIQCNISNHKISE